MVIGEKGILRIRVAGVEDARLLCRWWNDGEVMAHAGFPRGLGITEDRITESLSKDNEEGRRLILEHGDRPIGEMNYRTKEKGVAEIGIKICDSSYQGRGLGPEYLKMLIRYLFDERGFVKIVLDTNLMNRRARYVYEKLGFKKIGIRENSWMNQLGEWQTAVDYELDREARKDVDAYP